MNSLSNVVREDAPMSVRRKSTAAWLPILLLVGLVAAAFSQTAPEPRPLKPSPENKCPVCGMFVAEHMDFLAEIVFKDGACAFFDGVKDMFRFYFDMAAYVPSRSVTDIAAIYVTDYYSLNLVDGRKAFYVVGSDIIGPMGRELIPLAAERDAATFLEDHKGRSVLKFSDITVEIIKDIDRRP
jgi:nitrous oxide reductase accessory protein NosL